MWNSTFKDKPRRPLKRSAFKPKSKPYSSFPLPGKPSSLQRSSLRKLSKSPEAATKRRIQDLAREIVILRDGGCILRVLPMHVCSGFANDGHLILQADHLVSRGNSATYGDTRLIVCVCKGAHGWKSVGSNLRKAEYDRLVRSLLPPERVALWDMSELEAGKHKGVKMDWTLVEISLQQELKVLQLK